jgi:predicted phage terminase large subunit-like protein
MKNKPVSTAKLDLSKVKLPSLEEVMIALDRIKCQSLAHFVKQSWAILEPSTELKWGWAMDAICEHLEAVADGRITRLAIAVPPGCSKSLITSVFFPCWLWGPKGKADKRIIGTSHSKDLAIRDTMKSRTLIESEWFQNRWKVALKDDQNQKTNFANSSQGFREAAAFTKMTGKRGDIIICDDGLSAFDANSEAELRNAEIAFTETLPTRINNEKSAIIVIQQRLHQRDIIGQIIDRKLPYEKLVLPMRYEADNKCETSIGFSDPREVEGELLFPERFSEKTVQELEQVLGSYGVSSQLQQRPVPRDGGLFQRDWFKPLEAMPNDVVMCRGYDLAATVKETSAWTVGAKLGMTRDGKIIIMHIVRGRWTPGGVYNVVNQTAESDGHSVRISIPQDPGAAGLSVKSQFAQNLQGYDVRFSPESGDKTTRALPLAAQCEAGNVFYVKGDWNAAFFDEVCMFPNSTFKDITDACTRAYAELLKMTKPNGATVSCFAPMLV